jgi:cyclic pyranopterin phosphate synthase
MPGRLSHLSPAGQARMVDVSTKHATARSARAGGWVRMRASTLRAIERGDAPKGDVLGVARIAGIQAAKRTSDLIPLCHPLALTHVDIECLPDPALPGIRIAATVRCTGPTGAEMEALIAVAIAGLTLIDMAKGLDPWMTLEGVSLQEKSGGKRGRLIRPERSERR